MNNNNSNQYITLVIDADNNKVLEFRTIWAYHDLIWFLSWSNVAVRYKQTILGVLWAVIQPFLAMIVFSIFFGLLLGVGSDNIPYPLFSYAALLPWQYFSSALNGISMSLVSNQALLTKVFFPRIIIPVSSILPPLIDLGIASIMYFVLMLLYGRTFSWEILLLPLFLLLAIMTAFGFGIWIATLNVKYRDFRYILQFLLQIWLFASPVTYSTSIVPDSWLPIYSINPMVSVIDGFRWALLGGDFPALIPLLISTLISTFMVLSGLYYFNRNEGLFADII